MQVGDKIYVEAEIKEIFNSTHVKDGDKWLRAHHALVDIEGQKIHRLLQEEVGVQQLASK